MNGVGFEKHDHSLCIQSSISNADKSCAISGLQFTPVRRRVLEILLTEHRAMGAYELLDQLREEGLGSQPPVIYRALDFLVGNGFAHKIEQLNAFVACTGPDHEHTPTFLICRACSGVAEMQFEIETGVLATSAKSLGFHIEKAVIEAEGLCPKCAEGGTK